MDTEWVDLVERSKKFSKPWINKEPGLDRKKAIMTTGVWKFIFKNFTILEKFCRL